MLAAELQYYISRVFNSIHNCACQVRLCRLCNSNGHAYDGHIPGQQGYSGLLWLSTIVRMHEQRGSIDLYLGSPLAFGMYLIDCNIPVTFSSDSKTTEWDLATFNSNICSSLSETNNYSCIRVFSTVGASLRVLGAHVTDGSLFIKWERGSYKTPTGFKHYISV